MRGRFALHPTWWNSTCDNLKYIQFRALRKFSESNSQLDIFEKINATSLRTIVDKWFNNTSYFNRNLLLASSNDASAF